MRISFVSLCRLIILHQVHIVFVQIGVGRPAGDEKLYWWDKIISLCTIECFTYCRLIQNFALSVEGN